MFPLCVFGCNISRTLRGILSKLCTNVHSDSKMNWIVFGGYATEVKVTLVSCLTHLGHKKRSLIAAIDSWCWSELWRDFCSVFPQTYIWAQRWIGQNLEVKGPSGPWDDIVRWLYSGIVLDNIHFQVKVSKNRVFQQSSNTCNYFNLTIDIISFNCYH